MAGEVTKPGNRFPVPAARHLPVRWTEVAAQELFLHLRGKMSPAYHRLIDPAHPLNLKMAELLPGVFRHALLVSCAAAVAAYRIGANADLARVLGLYHDDGKLVAPDFFAGAITGIRTKAKEIANEKELTTLLQHPTNASLICLDYADIPEEVVLGIQQHHGTMKTYAHIEPPLAEFLKAHGGENRLRYHGPKPKTVEAALVMIADGVEALLASRNSLGEMPAPVTRPYIKQIVWKVCVDLWKDGQFKDSGLTSEQLFRAHELIMWVAYRYYHDYDIVSTPEHLRKCQQPIEPTKS